MVRTALTEMLGSTVPVIGAPMAGTAGPALAAAITAGGGTGMIGVRPGWTADDVAEALAEAGPGCGAGVLAWALETGQVDALVEAEPTLVAVSYGDWAEPAARLRAAGVRVATSAGTLAAAREAVDAGVDVLVVRGAEGGGHGRGEVATLPLLAQVLDEVDHPCVVAAGGIASARGLAAVIAAGAAGAWVGTAFLASPEANTAATTPDAVIGAGSTDTVYSRVPDVVSGAPWPRQFGGRSLRNRHIDRWAGREDELDDRTIDVIREAQRSGEAPVVWAGQSAGLVTARRPAAEIVADLGAGADALLRAYGR